MLRSALDMEGLYHIQIVACDGGWGIEKDMLEDKDLMKAVGVIGLVHGYLLQSRASYKSTV